MKNGKNTLLHLLQQMEAELKQKLQTDRTACSDECLRVMKRIYKLLRILIVENELAKVERRKQRGKLTGKQAQHERAKVRKSWL